MHPTAPYCQCGQSLHIAIRDMGEKSYRGQHPANCGQSRPAVPLIFDGERMFEIGPDEKVYSVFKIGKIADCLKAEGVPLQAALEGIDISDAELISP